MRALSFLLFGVVATAEPLVVTFGDSVTAPREGVEVYSEILAKELRFEGRPIRVLNRGVGGNTTAMALARFERDVLSETPDLVVIMFGINDSAVDVWKTPPAEEPRVSLAGFRQNLTTMIRTLKAQGVEVVVMTSNPKHWAAKTKELYGYPPYDPDAVDGFNPMLRQYVAATRDLAREEGVALIDVFAAFENYDRSSDQAPGALTPDGMHPSSLGQRLIADLLIAQLSAVDPLYSRGR